MTLLNTANKLYAGASAISKIYVGSNLIWPAPVTVVGGPSESLLVSYSPGANRNDFTGEVGVRLGIGSVSIPVNWLGVRVLAGNTGTRKLNLYEWFSGNLISTVTVNLSGAVAGQFVWGSISSVTLAANGYYALLMETTDADGKQWSNGGATTYQSAITNVYSCYRIPGNPLATASVNEQFVGVDLGWGGISPSFLPTDISGLNVWLDASQLALSDGATVNVWTNLGSGPATTIVSSLPLAVFKAGTLNGKGVVRLGINGSRVRFNGTGISWDYTLAYVGRMWGPNFGRVVSALYPSGGNLLIGYWSGNMDIAYTGGGSGFYEPASGKPVTTEWRLYSADGSTTTQPRFFSSGTFLGQHPGGITDNWGGTFNLSGYSAALDETCDCEIAEVMLYNRQLTDVERKNSENYLKYKWGLP